jgi:hypothetical protein
MKSIVLCIIVSITILNFSGAQNIGPYNTTDLTVNGVPFHTSKATILKTFGKPIKQFKPQYECGFLSAEEQGEIFYSLQYKGVKWTGNKKSKYVMEELFFTKGPKYVVVLSGKKLSGQTSLSDFIKLSGVKQDAIHTITPNQYPDRVTTYVDFYQNNSDDKFIFNFIDDKLYSIEYWSPC